MNQTEDGFRYVHLGEAPSGIHVLHAVRDFSPASGRFHYLCFVVFQYDEGLVEKDGILISRGRVLLKTLGSIVLGDRYNGELTYATGILKVGRSSSPWCRDEPGYELRIE